MSKDSDADSLNSASLRRVILILLAIIGGAVALPLFASRFMTLEASAAQFANEQTEMKVQITELRTALHYQTQSLQRIETGLEELKRKR